ncbi:MAG: DUF434 domain-containing protein [Planctomycetes bacterium]|nr:DUF434 domain-containing protein [Planctomycetota bacterium]
MPDRRKHRGPHPEDTRLFDRSVWPCLQQAVAHLSWLLTRGYAIDSSLKLVGDRLQLDARQRLAVRRSACSDQSLAHRARTHVPWGDVAGQVLDIDGFNVLTTVEAAMGGGILLQGRDDCVRDMASMHGSYRKVAETLPAIEAIGQLLASLAPARCVWWLDRPVSNSGRVSTLLLQLAAENGWPWQAELVFDPDATLRGTSGIVVSADSLVLDGCAAWLNLAKALVGSMGERAWVVPLGVGPESHEAGTGV